MDKNWAVADFRSYNGLHYEKSLPQIEVFYYPIPGVGLNVSDLNTYRNSKLDISTAPTKVRSREPAYSQALIQTKSIGSGSDPESQADRQSDGYGEWCLELRRGGR